MRATFIFGKVLFLVSFSWPFLLSGETKGKTDKQSRAQCAQQTQGFTPFFHFRDIYSDRLFILMIHPPPLSKEEIPDPRTLQNSVKK